uniref:Polyprotein n=1 Tax=Haemonchus contortus TaxID=6289 RepID=A0A7I4XS40_HAECO
WGTTTQPRSRNQQIVLITQRPGALECYVRSRLKTNISKRWLMKLWPKNDVSPSNGNILPICYVKKSGQKRVECRGIVA